MIFSWSVQLLELLQNKYSLLPCHNLAKELDNLHSVPKNHNQIISHNIQISDNSLPLEPKNLAFFGLG